MTDIGYLRTLFRMSLPEFIVAMIAMIHARNLAWHSDPMDLTESP
jgi:hypothetical protein